MPLTALKVKNAAPRASDYGLADGGGLFLWVRPNGTKSWRFRFRLDGKQSHISLGTVERVPLAQARALAADARQIVAQGKHPGTERRQARAQAATERENTFQALALAWHEHKRVTWSEGYAADVLGAMLNRFGMPYPAFLNVPSEVAATIERKNGLTFHYANDYLSAMHEAAERFWRNPDPNNPHLQKQVQAYLAERLGPLASGRICQALAVAIRPKEYPACNASNSGATP